MPRTLLEELTTLHDAYASAVNRAVDEDDLQTADELARAYDEDAWALVAEWEGKAHLLSALRRPAYDTPLRRLVDRLRLAGVR